MDRETHPNNIWTERQKKSSSSSENQGVWLTDPILCIPRILPVLRVTEHLNKDISISWGGREGEREGGRRTERGSGRQIQEENEEKEEWKSQLIKYIAGPYIGFCWGFGLWETAS